MCGVASILRLRLFPPLSDLGGTWGRHFEFGAAVMVKSRGAAV